MKVVTITQKPDFVRATLGATLPLVRTEDGRFFVGQAGRGKIRARVSIELLQSGHATLLSETGGSAVKGLHTTYSLLLGAASVWWEPVLFVRSKLHPCLGMPDDDTDDSVLMWFPDPRLNVYNIRNGNDEITGAYPEEDRYDASEFEDKRWDNYNRVVADNFVILRVGETVRIWPRFKYRGEYTRYRGEYTRFISSFTWDGKAVMAVKEAKPGDETIRISGAWRTGRLRESPLCREPAKILI